MFSLISAWINGWLNNREAAWWFETPSCPLWHHYNGFVLYAGTNQHHDDVIKWKHFPRYWPFVRGIHRSPVNSPHKGQWRGALMFTLICARKNGWVNNHEAGDLRRYRGHYEVTVMTKQDPQTRWWDWMDDRHIRRHIMLHNSISLIINQLINLLIGFQEFHRRITWWKLHGLLCQIAWRNLTLLQIVVWFI